MRLDVRVQRQIAELHFRDERKSSRSLATGLQCHHSTVSYLRKKIVQSGKRWQDLALLDDDQFRAALGTARPAIPGAKVRPDWSYIRSQLELPDANLHVLWREFREVEPEGIGYSVFTAEYRKFERSLSVTMRMPRRPGEMLYCDFAGRTVPVRDKETGEDRQAQIFICSMGASSKTFAFPVWTQREEDWIDCHVAAFEYYQGVPKWTVPDNLKAAVINRKKHFIEINAGYFDCLRHYDTATLPARPRKGNDKGAVEAAVRLIQSWVLFNWRTRVFWSLEELRLALLERCEFINNKPVRRLGWTRNSRFEQIDKPALLPLPVERYQRASWRYNVMVSRDYRVEHEHSHYMVPYTLASHRVDVRTTSKTLEVFHKSKRVALHPLATVKGSDIQDRAYMPPNHVRVLEGESKELLAWAETVGPGVSEMIRYHLFDRTDRTNSYRAANRIRDLGRQYKETIEEACAYCVKYKIFALKNIEAVLRNKAHAEGVLNHEGVQPDARRSSGNHENNRDADYFGEEY